MKTVKQLKEYIEHLSDDTLWYAYEGEDVGVAFVDSKDIRKEVGFLSSKESGECGK